MCDLHDSLKNIKFSSYGKAPVIWINVDQNIVAYIWEDEIY